MEKTHTGSGSDHLIQMANDIGNFFRSQPRREDAIAGIANHIANFWTKRMREKLMARLEQREQGLDELPLEALKRLSRSTAAPAR
jgi:formate dehydrogenase subunit delta